MSEVVSSKTLTCVDFHGNKHEVPVGDLRWRPSTYAIVVRGDKILLTRQVGTYNLPGGGMEFGELPEHALVREIKSGPNGLLRRDREGSGVLPQPAR